MVLEPGYAEPPVSFHLQKTNMTNPMTETGLVGVRKWNSSSCNFGCLCNLLCRATFTGAQLQIMSPGIRETTGSGDLTSSLRT